MGGLGHYLEQDGLATTQISLVREHTEKMRPPRALWVPFEMGRPLGVPRDIAFQKRVVLAALELLEAPEGPVLADFPEDAPGPGDESGEGDFTGWVCPVNLGPPPPSDAGEGGPLLAALEREAARLGPWYDLALRRGGGTTVGASGIAIDAVPRFITSFLGGRPAANPRAEVPLYEMLVFACDDLRAYYIEAVTAQPGRASSAELTDWFWKRTTAAEVMLTLRTLSLESGEEERQAVADRFVPEEVVEKLASEP